MGKIYAITLEGIAGTNVWELFDEVQKFKDVFPVVKLDINGTVVNAGIYETGEQLANSIDAVNHGNKEEIMANLPSTGDSTTIGAALELMSSQMENKGFEGFSTEEIEEIMKQIEQENVERGR
jgi:hypothetical protein